MAAEAGIGQGGYRMGRVSDEAADLGLGEFKVAAAAAAAGSGCYGGADLVTNGAPGKRVHRPAPPPHQLPALPQWQSLSGSLTVPSLPVSNALGFSPKTAAARVSTGINRSS